MSNYLAQHHSLLCTTIIGTERQGFKARWLEFKANGEYTGEVRLMSTEEPEKARFMRKKRRAKRPECWNTLEIALTKRHDKKISDYFNSLLEAYDRAVDAAAELDNIDEVGV